MQIQITPTPQPNTILFCKVDIYENKKVKNPEGKTIISLVKIGSVNLVTNTNEKVMLSRVRRKHPKCNPVLLKCEILSKTKR